MKKALMLVVFFVFANVCGAQKPAERQSWWSSAAGAAKKAGGMVAGYAQSFVETREEAELKKEIKKWHDLITTPRVKDVNFISEWAKISNPVAKQDILNERFFGRTLLHSAVTKDDTNIVELILSANKDLVDVAVEAGFPEAGLTPLHLASMLGYDDIVDVLLKNGAKVDIVDSQGNTALHLAAMYGNATTVGKILKYVEENTKKINIIIRKFIDFKNSQDFNAVQIAIERVKSNTKPAAKDKFEKAFEAFLLLAARYGMEDVANLAIDSNIVTSSMIYNLLTVAANNKHLDFVALFLKYAINVLKKLRNEEAHTIDVITNFFKNATPETRNECWLWAADIGIFDIIEILLNNHLIDDINTKSGDSEMRGCTALDFAVISHENFINEPGIKENKRLFQKIIDGKSKILDLLLKQKSLDVSVKIEGGKLAGFSPLLLAAAFGSESSVEALLESNVHTSDQVDDSKKQPSTVGTKYEGFTALHFLIMRKFYGTIEKIVKKDPNLISIKNSDQLSPVDFAFKCENDVAVIPVLLKAGISNTTIVANCSSPINKLRLLKRWMGTTFNDSYQRIRSLWRSSKQ